MTKKRDYSGFSFSFSDTGGDFGGTVEVQEYKHDDGTPNELILICGSKKYNLGTDVANLSSERHEETTQTTSAAKSLGKLALAGMAGNAVQNNAYAMAGMLASGSQSINTNKTVTEIWRNILIQFKDKKILMLNKVSANQWYKFDDAFRVFTYDEYHTSIDDKLSSYETKGIKLREKIGSMSGSEKEQAFKEIEALKTASILLPSKRAEIRKIALEKNLVKNLTKEEQAEVDARIAYVVAKKKKNDEKIAAKQKKDAERHLEKLERMSDLKFAKIYEYEGISKETTGIKLWIYANFTVGLYLIFELRKRSENKKFWKNIESSDNLLDEFKKFRKTKIKELTTK